MSFILPTTKAPIWDGEYFCPRASTQASPLLWATILYGTLVMSLCTSASVNLRPINLTRQYEDTIGGTGRYSPLGSKDGVLRVDNGLSPRGLTNQALAVYNDESR